MDPQAIRDAVAALAEAPISMPFERWNEVSNVLLSAADDVERLSRCRDALKAIMQAHGPGTLASDELYAMAVDALREG